MSGDPAYAVVKWSAADRSKPEEDVRNRMPFIVLSVSQYERAGDEYRDRWQMIKPGIAYEDAIIEKDRLNEKWISNA